MSEGPCPVRVTLQVAIDNAGNLPAEAAFSEWVNSALRASETDLPASACVTIRLVDEAESSALNAGYRSVDKATNVLAFPASPPLIPELAEEETELGDLVICHEVVLREAREQNKNVPEHMAHLAIHGALHLVGYDHLNEAEAVHMETLETRVMQSLGFNDPYQ